MLSGKQSADNFITTQGLKFNYLSSNDKRAIAALDSIDALIGKGEFVAIIGRNGSGKSTFAQTFNALLLPTEGVVTVKGMDTSDSSKLSEIRRTTGMVFQNPDNQIVATIVEDDVAFGPENMGLLPETIRENVNNSLATVGMQEYSKHFSHKLSGGQKQRIAVAGILAMNPECIIFDEATSMLDAQGRKEVLDIALRLNRENNITIIYITHNMEEAVYADRVLVMDKGKIVLQGKAKEVFSHIDYLNSIGLRAPQATQLANELYKTGIDVSPNLLHADELIKSVSKAINTDRVHYIEGKDSSDVDSAKAKLSAIRFEGVSHTYQEGTPFEKRAIQDINLTIYEEEYVAIVGNTGSGKSTLLQHINGILAPSSGTVYVGNNEVAKGDNLQEIRKKVGLVFQFPEHQLFEETVYKDIAFGPKNQGLTESEIRDRVLEAVQLVGLEEDILWRSPFNLSGGEKRRVAMAGVLALHTDILVLDEPTAGLDPEGREKILDMIWNLKGKRRLTVILVTHNIEDVSKYLDRIVVIRDGKIHYAGPLKNMLGMGKFYSNDIALPTIPYIMHNLKGFQPGLKTDIYTVEQARDEILRYVNLQ